MKYLKRFFHGLDHSQKVELLRVAKEWQREEQTSFANRVSLLNDELFLAVSGDIGKIKAIKLVRKRTKCSLLVSKQIVEINLERLRKT